MDQLRPESAPGSAVRVDTTIEPWTSRMQSDPAAGWFRRRCRLPAAHPPRPRPGPPLHASRVARGDGAALRLPWPSALRAADPRPPPAQRRPGAWRAGHAHRRRRPPGRAQVRGQGRARRRRAEEGEARRDRDEPGGGNRRRSGRAPAFDLRRPADRPVGGRDRARGGAPELSAEAIEKGIEGIVVVVAFVNTLGEVEDVALERSVAAPLDEEAVRAAYRTLFEPYLPGGRLQPVFVRIRYNFELVSTLPG